MKENHLEKPCGSWNPYLSEFYEREPPGENPYPNAFYERRTTWRSLAGAGILILVHFMKENHLEKLCGTWNPYPSAFYEGELPGEAPRELESLS